MFKEKDLHFGW